MDKIEVYRDDSQEYRWRRKAPNGEIIADSAEGYVDLDDAFTMAARVNPDVFIQLIEEEDA